MKNKPHLIACTSQISHLSGVLAVDAQCFTLTNWANRRGCCWNDMQRDKTIVTVIRDHLHSCRKGKRAMMQIPIWEAPKHETTHFLSHLSSQFIIILQVSGERFLLQSFHQICNRAPVTLYSAYANREYLWGHYASHSSNNWVKPWKPRLGM